MPLTAKELNTVFECLRAAAYGPFFPDWEFPTLFGLDREEVMDVAEKWPIVNQNDDIVWRAVNNAMNHLLGYPLKSRDAWDDYLSVSRDEIYRVYMKWRGESSPDSLQGYFDLKWSPVGD